MRFLWIKPLFCGLFAVFYSFTLQAQKPSEQDMNLYTKDWAAIDQFEYDGQPKSALEAAQKLFEKIQADTKNPYRTAQYIKALLYINKYQAQLEEDGLVKAIYRFQQELDKSEFPVRPILQSMVAEMYDQYLAQQLYKFRDRTTTDGSFKQEDIRTWDVQRITNRCYELYLASVQETQTRGIRLEDYSSILQGGYANQGLFPTLYDLLMHRALTFFRSERNYLTQPAYKFYIEQEVALGDAQAFMDMRWEAKDSLSAHFQSLQLFQEWLRFHAKDADIRAFVNVDLERLKYIQSVAVLNNKADLYLAQIEKLAAKHSSHEVSAEINHLIAQHYYQQGSSYNPQSKDDPKRWYWKKALEICEKANTAFPNSYGAEHCRALISDIKGKSLSVQTEKVNLPQSSILTRLEYRNLTKVHIKALRLSETQWENFRSKNQEDGLKFLNGMTPVLTWSMEIPDQGDYRTHSAEIKVPGLPTGFYLLMVSESSDYRYAKNAVTYTPFYSSNIAYMYRTQNYQNEFYVTDRRTGAPLKGVKMDFYVQRYNSMLHKYEYIKSGTAVTDSLGYALSAIPRENAQSYYSQSFRVRFKYNDDELYTEDYFYEYHNNSQPYDQPQTQFFTDRTIYRPGQTVYFKAILLNRMTDGKNPRIVPNTPVLVTFYDANSQKVAELPLTSNEFGSVQGNFTAPASGLTGQMHLRASHGNNYHYFRVEEYKRPKFESKFNPVAGSFKVDEKVQVKGVAKAYAGNAIDEAQVKYRVVRQTSFPYWRWWRWGWYNPYNQAAQEITFGETKTNAAGEFEVEFTAIADKSIPQDRQPVFNYTVYADITDNTGETRSCTTQVRVGFVALDVSVNVPSTVLREKLDTMELDTRNLNYEFEPAQGTITVEQLQTPSVVYNKRYWSKPDVYLMQEKDFAAEFPHYAYQDEDETYAWKTVKTVAELKFDTKASKDLALNWGDWAQGMYKMTLKTQDKFGSPIEMIRYFKLYSATEKTVPMNDALFLSQDYWPSVEPGEKAQFDFGSHQKGAYLLLETEQDGKITSRQWIQANERQQYTLAIEEKHRGNLHFHLSAIQNNRQYCLGGTVAVPWSNKELEITYETFRDKLMPGQDEEWRIKIAGKLKDKVAAELLAGMYDASLDAFAPSNYWSMWLHPTNYRQYPLQGYQNFTTASSSMISNNWWVRSYASGRQYQELNWFSFVFYEYAYYQHNVTRSSTGGGGRNKGAVLQKEEKERKDSPSPKPGAPQTTASMDADGFADKMDDAPPMEPQPDSNLRAEQTDGKPDGDGGFDEVKIRTNLSETVFFMPQMATDADGNVILKFKMNEALTRWKFMTFAHTKDLSVGYTSRNVITQKDLMITPNAPRFFRQRDEIYFTAKIANVTKEKISGQATLQLYDAVTMQPIDLPFENTNAVQSFSVDGERSVGLSWRLKVPADWTNAVTHRVIAKAGSFSDGEESSLPVLSNQMLVTETMPLPIRGGETAKFKFERMEEVSKSPTMRQHQLTLEFTPNPAWYAIQSLPYLMEYPYECTEQIFSRYYANSLASNVANAHPKIKKVFDTWRDYQPSALESNLTKNQELKYALIEETPWVLDAQNEAQQKKNVGILFDLNRMGNELSKARDKMAERQLSNGGFSWFPGGRDSWYITQYIVEGFGHLDALGVKEIESDAAVKRMTSKAVAYTDGELATYYRELLRAAKESGDEKAYLAKDHLTQIVIHYLYARSFFLDQKVENDMTQKAIEYYENQAKTYWRNQGLYMKGMLALALHRKGKDKETPQMIVTSLRENSLNSKEMGMYWKYPSGYYWYELPIETHAMMIEVFDEVANDAKAVDDLKTWLLKAKQTTHWKTTKATASACYALLRRGDNWLLEDKEVVIKLGKEKLDQSKIQKEAGTGYFKTKWTAAEIKPEMANVTIENPNKNVAWGAMYWQYFEDLDKITHFQETPLKISKKLFKVVNTDRGEVLKPIENEKLVPGDLVKVRIEIIVDRSMEYVHLKDMRASGFEPVNVLSQYKYQGGLGYYESTKDMATHFFMDYLSKGTYVFEYPLRVNHRGDFSNGITTMQCMYAPEFTSHSEGIRIKIE